MANRFTDSRKWDDPWFRKLPCKYKAFFIFLLDKCNHAGIWKIDFESAEFHIGEKLNKEELLSIMNGRIVELKEKWFIPKFINFQYQVSSFQELNPENRVHKSVLDLLKKEGAYKGLKSPVEGCKDKDYDKDKDKDKDKYGDFVFLTKEEHLKLLTKWGPEKLNNLLEILNNGIGAKGYKYKSHYHALLTWEKREIKNGKSFVKQECSGLLSRAKEELGRMAKVEDIVKWLKQLPENEHSQLRFFLLSRYPKDADQAWGQAEALYKRGKG